MCGKDHRAFLPTFRAGSQVAHGMVSVSSARRVRFFCIVALRQTAKSIERASSSLWCVYKCDVAGSDTSEGACPLFVSNVVCVIRAPPPATPCSFTHNVRSITTDLSVVRTCMLVAFTDSQLGSFGWVKVYLFPVWFVLVVGGFLVLEPRKQARRFFAKGAASICGVMSIVNEFHDDSVHKVEGRLIPRTMDLPTYSVAAFNEKVNVISASV